MDTPPATPRPAPEAADETDPDADADFQRAIMQSMGVMRSPAPAALPGAAAARFDTNPGSPSPFPDGAITRSMGVMRSPAPAALPGAAAARFDANPGSPPPFPDGGLLPRSAPDPRTRSPAPGDGAERQMIRTEQNEAFQQSMERDRQRMAPRVCPVEPAADHSDAMEIRVKLASGEVCRRRFLLEEPLRVSVCEFVHFKHRSRQPVRIGVRDGTRIRWLRLDESLQAQGVLPMDTLVCQPREPRD